MVPYEGIFQRIQMEHKSCCLRTPKGKPTFQSTPTVHHIDSGTKYPPCLLLIGWKHFFHGPFGPHQPTTTPAASLHVSLMYDFFFSFQVPL